MKNWKRWLALPLSLALVVSLCACGSADGDETASIGPDASPSIEVDLSRDVLDFSAGLSADDILLTVNGEDIPADLFLYLLFMDCNFYYYYYGYPVDLIADDLLEDTVYIALYHTICRQKAIELGCVLTDEQRAEVEAGKTGENREFYEQDKAAFGLTDESMDFRATLEYYSNNLLGTVPMPTEEELREYLDAQGMFYVKHILLKTVDDARQPLPEDAAAEKKAQAEDILAQLQAVEDGERLALFDELMNRYSEDGRDENGDLYSPDGYVFTDSSSLVGGFREAALELEEGQMSGIVETDYGYHIMLRLPFTDEMKEAYRTEIRQKDLGSLMEQWINEAEVVRAPALDTLDVAAFFDRYTAYQNALYDQQAGEDAVG